jgi:DNA-binding response OmpR family regulator
MRKSLTRLLSSFGYDVAAASSGMRAVAVTRTFQPDAVVIDMSLGDTTGVELATRLRAVRGPPSTRLGTASGTRDRADRRTSGASSAGEAIDGVRCARGHAVARVIALGVINDAI